MIFINFKNYDESSGEKGRRLLDGIGDVSAETQVPIIPVVPALSLAEYTGHTLLPLWVQHVDPVEYGACTGWILPKEVARLHGKGSFLNHSEHPISIPLITKTLKYTSEAGLKSLVLAKDILNLQKIIKLRPDYIAYEPPELVGSTTTSVSQAKPEVIYTASELCKNAGIPLIVGAGIHSTEDVEIALEQGAAGVAVATDIVKSQDPKASLRKLLLGFRKK